MTELELMELLGEINGGYIQQAEAFRQGRLRIVKKKRPIVSALQILSTAAMLAVILGAGYLGLRGQVKRENQETANETMVMQSDETAGDEALADWKQAILRENIGFYSLDYKKTLTMSEFCAELARQMGVGEPPKPARYTVLDMDGDGLDELVVEFDGIGSIPSLVLGSFDREIRGVEYFIRQMKFIKADGTFYYSGGIGNRGWGRLRRNADGWVLEKLDGDFSSAPDAVWAEWGSLDMVTESEKETQTDASKVTPELLMREASVNLTIWEGNSKYPVLADLFIGEGYSLYIPREGWIHETIDYHGTTADRWVMAEETPEEFARNTMIDTQNREQLQKFYDEKYQTRLTILFRPGMDNQAIRDWVTEVNPDWNLTQNAKGSLFGDTAAVTFLPTETGVFVCIQETSASQPEEWGILGAICESFSGWPSELTGYLTGVEDRPAEISVSLTRYSDATRCWEEYTLPFTRYRAYGYSTYIPKEGFVFQKTQEEARFGGCSADVWTCEKNENVWFGVVKLGTSGYNDAIRWGLLLDGYDLYEDQSGGVSGQSKDGTQFLSVSFRQKDFYGIYAVMCHYPVGEADDLAGVVNVMANQFRAE